MTTSELFKVLTPADAWAKFLQHFTPQIKCEPIATWDGLDRVLAEDVIAREDLPSFARSVVDGYAVNAKDTHGASSGLPALLHVIGEAPMGMAVEIEIGAGQAVLTHTGSMLAKGANAVVMVEHTQQLARSDAGVGSSNSPSGIGGQHSPLWARGIEIEVMRPVAEGENVLQVGEDVRAGQTLFEQGHCIRPQDIGGLVALGITEIRVAMPPRVGIISTGDEVVPPDRTPAAGQVRDVNSYALAAQVIRAGGAPVRYGIVPDQRGALEESAMRAKSECDVVVLSAGSSVSYRDMSVEVIGSLGRPGVLVHGVSVKPGKPTIIAVCDGVPVFGLPGNPASAMVIFDLFVAPAIRLCLGERVRRHPQLQARLTKNIPSTTGREDFVQVQLEERNGELVATPVFGKSNLIYTLVRAEGTVKVPLDSNGLRAGEVVSVMI